MKRCERYLHDKTRRYIAFDIETTGLNPLRGDRMVEVGAVAIERGIMGEEFHRLIDIGRPIPKKAWRVHGITGEMLTGQPQAEEVLDDFRQFIDKGVLVTHNADFDIAFLAYECSRIGQSLCSRHFCTLKISRKLFPGLPNYRLETVAKHIFGIEIDKGTRHRALDDARLTAKIWLELREMV
jgi:DNA polymerase-3 subunit epsilon